MGQNKSIDETLITKNESAIYAEDIRLTQIKQIKHQQAIFNNELNNINEYLKFTVIALCVVAIFLLITIVFLIFVINKVGL